MKKLVTLFVFVALTGIVVAQVSQTANVTTPGSLATVASSYLTTVTNLTVTGTIDARDIKTMREQMPLLAVLNLSSASIVTYTGTEGTSSNNVTYLDDQLPSNSFYNGSTGKTSLTTVTLPANLKSISGSAFAYCTGITSIVLPNSITSIAGYVFIGCTGLTSIILPTGLTTLGDQAFKSCTNLAGEIILPEGFTTIGSQAFVHDAKIVKVTLPSTLSAIGQQDFQNCTSLTTIVCKNATPPTLAYNTFYNTPAVTDVLVPNVTAEAAYEGNSQWSAYFSSSVVKLDPTAGKLELAMNRIKVYSALSNIVIDGTNSGEDVTLFSVTGRQIINVKSQGGQMILPCKLSGVYIMKVNNFAFKVIL